MEPNWTIWLQPKYAGKIRTEAVWVSDDGYNRGTFTYLGLENGHPKFQLPKPSTAYELIGGHGKIKFQLTDGNCRSRHVSHYGWSDPGPDSYMDCKYMEPK